MGFFFVGNSYLFLIQGRTTSETYFFFFGSGVTLLVPEEVFSRPTYHSFHVSVLSEVSRAGVPFCFPIAGGRVLSCLVSLECILWEGFF